MGNIIEWYDFYIFGSLAAILAAQFFEKSHPVAAFLSTVALFSVGFLIRPLGAFVFGWLGDKVGRKYTFLVTLRLADPLHPLPAPRRHRHLHHLGKVAVPAAVNYPLAILIVVILVNYVGMTCGPIAAFLAEFFPGRIRYTSVSVPYHIGNGWGGGLVPIITTSAYLSTHGLGWALAYPIGLPAIMFVLALILMPETRKISIWEPIPGPGEAKA